VAGSLGAVHPLLSSGHLLATPTDASALKESHPFHNEMNIVKVKKWFRPSGGSLYYIFLISYIKNVFLDWHSDCF
jgi:hypothetical protein